MEDVVKTIEVVLEKLKQDPVKLAEDKEVQLKTLLAKQEVLEKNHKLAIEYIAALEEQVALLRKTQCTCDLTSTCSASCGGKQASEKVTMPCDIALGICPMGFGTANKKYKENAWDTFWYYITIAALFYWFILLFVEQPKPCLVCEY